ncbi:protein YLS7-like [Hibiscus syriacus]|uniref:Protein YLS7-like n=1 Tax=Hibiscus syriacus TaxID=106335 RepID=A0A6A3D0B2_HIBSY|nr:gibberellin 2-beta-dioxygenase 8-like [Hibiscus syriacus]KAE8734856.1 protein YLS7-like [Hibiscus syriacus]
MSNLESYPPDFHHLNGSPAPLLPQLNNHSMEDSSSLSVSIPVVDLQCLSLEKLGQACKEWGLFRLVNHGIPPSLLSKLEEYVKMLFALPFESKQALLTNPFFYFWGTPVLTPSGAALRGALNINWLEGINVPLSQLPQFQSEDPRLEDFRHSLEEYGRHLSRIATALFEAMVKSLNLCPKQSESSLDESTGFVRLYRYPPRSVTDEACGMMEHTDSSVLSIVNQDQVGGLEILKDNKWLLVSPISGTLLVHIGDMMQAISDDQYMSVKHRVRVNKQEERVSICYFVFPAKCSVIRSSKYKPFTYTDFQEQVQNDTKTLGYKVGLDRFKLNAPL